MNRKVLATGLILGVLTMSFPVTSNAANTTNKKVTTTSANKDTTAA